MDCFDITSAYLGFILIHTKTYNDGFKTNYMRCIIDKTSGDVRSGKLFLNSNFISLSHYNAEVAILEDKLLIKYKAQFKNVDKRIVFRLNPGFQIIRIIASKAISIKQSDSLRNSYEILTNEKNEKIEIYFEYEGRPWLRYGNILSANRICIWGESQIFPTMDYMPVTKSMYRIKLFHKPELKVIGGESIYSEDRYVGSELISSRPCALPAIICGKYSTITACIDNRVNVLLYYDDNYDENVILHVEKAVHFYESLFGETPFTRVDIVFDKEARISCTQGSTIIMRNQNIQELTHELAHLWWGSSVTFYGKGANWIHEAMANLCSRLYHGHTIKAIGKNRKISFGDLENMYYNNIFGTMESVYDKGVILLCQAILSLGEEVFWVKIKTLCETYKYSNVFYRKAVEIFQKQGKGFFEILCESEVRKKY